MVLYNFKKIQVVPSGKDFIDITLSKTQRKTPTEIHRHYAISRIRKFYMRKVKYTQQTYHDKLSQILADFPLLNDIHPFYADLINILYDKDHYKLALGQLNNARHLIDNIAKDYLRLLKYGDSMYRCQSLKKAALGRMCTLIRKIAPSLAYLEQVRQHLARLPSIEPTTRTLIVCGYPNVGKSSFMNKVTRANVDVQPFAFTTKSLFVGHTEHKYVRWQVIDTPGILDHPLEDRNTIEMLSITALAHLQAAILYIIDISEQCGYTIEEQVKLFNSIKPLFVGKPLFIVTNKIDTIRPEEVRPEAWKLIQDLANPEAGGSINTKILSMSTLTEEGVQAVKELACDVLLEDRVDKKMKSKIAAHTISRVHVALPVARDEKSRPPSIPKSVADVPAPSERPVLTKAQQAQRAMERNLAEERDNDAMWENGEVPGMNSKLWRERWRLSNPDWKFDVIPEIIDGQTIFDFVDPDIEQALEELEREENERVQKLEEEEAMKSSESEIDDETMDIINKIRYKRAILRLEHKTGVRADDEEHSKVGIRNKVRTFDKLENHLTVMGLDEGAAAETADRVRERSRSQSRGRKRERSESRGRSASRSAPRDEEAHLSDKKKAKREKSRSRTLSLTPKPGQGYSNVQNRMKAAKIYKNLMVIRGKDAKKGEADRHIPDLKPKHLFTGKRGVGKTDRR